MHTSKNFDTYKNPISNDTLINQSETDINLFKKNNLINTDYDSYLGDFKQKNPKNLSKQTDLNKNSPLASTNNSNFHPNSNKNENISGSEKNEFSLNLNWESGKKQENLLDVNKQEKTKIFKMEEKISNINEKYIYRDEILTNPYTPDGDNFEITFKKSNNKKNNFTIQTENNRKNFNFEPSPRSRNLNKFSSQPELFSVYNTEHNKNLSENNKQDENFINFKDYNNISNPFISNDNSDDYSHTVMNHKSSKEIKNNLKKDLDFNVHSNTDFMSEKNFYGIKPKTPDISESNKLKQRLLKITEGPNDCIKPIFNKGYIKDGKREWLSQDVFNELLFDLDITPKCEKKKNQLAILVEYLERGKILFCMLNDILKKISESNKLNAFKMIVDRIYDWPNDESRFNPTILLYIPQSDQQEAEDYIKKNLKNNNCCCLIF